MYQKAIFEFLYATCRLMKPWSIIYISIADNTSQVHRDGLVGQVSLHQELFTETP